ncbi:MAG TPA: hypothetical protein DDW98_00710 [Gammaproteobacteria bacterium]|nr:hypothetical protein [Gammaproteobacteria bacterium]
MSKFIAYELAPATEMSGEVMAHDDEASAKAIACDYFWSLYGRNHDQTVTCIGDFQTYDFAAEIYHGITGHPKPANLGLRRLRHLAA